MVVCVWSRARMRGGATPRMWERRSLPEVPEGEEAHLGASLDPAPRWLVMAARINTGPIPPPSPEHRVACRGNRCGAAWTLRRTAANTPCASILEAPRIFGGPWGVGTRGGGRRVSEGPQKSCLLDWGRPRHGIEIIASSCVHCRSRLWYEPACVVWTESEGGRVRLVDRAVSWVDGRRLGCIGVGKG